MARTLRIAIVAGEMSGDFLGSALISALQHQMDDSIEFFGIAGPKMRDAGVHSLYSTEEIMVMGISDVLRCYPRLKWIHKKFTQYLLKNPPDLFIGIDAPDFNLPLEIILRQHKIKVVHYVSPKIWAWRPERVHKIRQAVDLLLTLFPFENKFYAPYDVPVKFVGHPLADLIDLSTNTTKMKSALGYTDSQKIIAVLPGSRLGELKHIGPLFLDVMNQVQLRYPDMQFITPMVNQQLMQEFKYQLTKKKYPLNLKISNRSSHELMAAANLVLVKSGTSTLEAALLKKPMVVAFKMSALSYRIIAPKVSVTYTALPNLLSDQMLVPEFIQDNADINNITNKIYELLNDHAQQNHLTEEFLKIHYLLRQNANQIAATSILTLLN